MSTTPKLWKPPTQVNTTDTGYEGNSQIAALHDGGYVVVWIRNSDIFAQRYDCTGDKLGGEVALTPLGDGSAYYAPAVTVLDNGNIALAFSTVDAAAPDDADVKVRIFDPALNLLRTDAGDTSNAKQTYNPSLTALAGGGYVISYTTGVGVITPNSGPDDTDIVARIVSPTGVVGAQFDIDNQDDNRDLSQLATLSNGNFVAVYQDEFLGSETDTDIRYGIFTPTGAHVGLPGFYVPGANGNWDEHHPDVAALRGGGFVVVWSDPDGGAHVQAAILSNTGTLVRDNINLDSPSTEHHANVVALADGGFLVSWEALGSSSVCLAQRFDADGDKVGAQFTVKDGMAYETPAAALLSDGHIAFALGDNSTGDTDVATSIFTVDTPNDFDANGKSDILWQNNNGTPAVWLMNGLSVTGAAFLPDPGPAWHAIDAGDFDGDDHADILWQHDDGTPAVWLMDGLGLTNSSALPNPGPAWHAIDAGDFNGDGRADILWQAADGTPSVWLMDGLNAIGSVVLPNPGPGWHAIDTGDFNSDNRADILWQADDGTPSVWLMDGLNAIGSVVLPNPGLAWHAIDTGDFNGDGRADILWQADDGTPSVWLMDGLNAIGSAVLPNPGPDWHAIA
jgi:hypothetical protein